jgi:class 3 adenylate cyclase/tetratricopeptide (TPR) repeat protein
MPCPACGHANPSGSRFCLQCGAALGARCASCGAELPAGARFCNQCGAEVAAAEAPSPSSPARPRAGRAPRDYTPRHLAEKILTQKSSLEGERKRVSVLFADVKSSMDLQQAVDPEEWHRILDRFFQILADGVHRFEGTVNQYTGDGIMALFGAPIAHEDHAQRACYAALQLGDAVREYARELRRERGLDFSMRVGINSGEVVVGKIGDDLRMDYTAQGHTVGLAARMEALAEPGTAYLTGETAALVEGYFALEDLGAFTVKGVAEPVPVFELVGVGPLRTRFDVSRARGLSRFVGREADLGVLESALEGARSGKGRALGIVAPAGVGKSRLCFEFAERCRARGVTVIQGHCVPHGQAIPLLPVLEIFRVYFGIGEREEPRAAREKIAGRLLLIDEQFREVLPIMFDFLGVPDPERPAPAMDPEARQRRIVAVVRSLIERGNPTGFLILIEDLHWADPASAAFFAQWVDAITNGPGLMLLNFRPEFRADWMQKSWYQQLPLDPLGPGAVRELLGELLGGDPSLAGLADRIYERARGNPYFTEEIVRSLVDTGTLTGGRGRYRLTRPVASLEVPDSVHAVLSARIDRLPEREKKLLQTAAVIGKEFAEPLLAAAAELPRPELADALAALEAAEFVHAQSLYPVAEYAFAHPLTQEVALGSQLQVQRRRTHAAVARAIQQLEPDLLDERAALVAHHYDEAGEELEAARWHARAATWVGTRDQEGTFRHWQRVRDLLVALPADRETPETVGLHLSACVQMVGGGWRLGLAEAAVEAIYEEGCALAERAGNATLLGALRGNYAARLATLGKIRDALALAVETLHLADGAPGVTDTQRAASRLGAVYTHYLAGRLAEALAFTEEGERLTGGDVGVGTESSGFSSLIFYVGNRAILLGAMGRCREAVRELERARRLAAPPDFRENLGWAQGVVAMLSYYIGDVELGALGDARAAALEALEIAEEQGGTFSRAIAYATLGVAHLAADAPEPAEQAFEESLALIRERRVALEIEALVLAHLSGAVRRRGDPARARALAEDAVTLSEGRGQQLLAALAQLALARALCALEGRKARAAVEAALTAALAHVAESGARSLEPQIEEARAELARVCADDAARDHHLQQAHRLYSEIGASGHARRLAQTLGLG